MMNTRSHRVLLVAAVAVVGCAWYFSSISQTEETAAAVVVEPPSTPALRKITVAESDSEAVERAIAYADKVARENLVLSEQECRELLSFIQSPRPEKLSTGEWQHLVNSIFNATRKPAVNMSSAEAVSPYAGALIALASSQDPVLANYAIQHTSFWFPLTRSEQDRSELLALLKKEAGLAGKPQANAGTALMILNDLLSKGAITASQVNKKELTQVALMLAEGSLLPADADKKDQLAKRITAFHTLCDHRTPESLPVARRVAADDTEHMLIRKVAVFTIGKLGSTAQDQPLLEKLAQMHPRLKQPSRYALNSLSSR